MTRGLKVRISLSGIPHSSVAAIDPMTRGLKALTEWRYLYTAGMVAAIDPMTRGLKDGPGLSAFPVEGRVAAIDPMTRGLKVRRRVFLSGRSEVAAIDPMTRGLKVMVKVTLEVEDQMLQPLTR